MLIVHCLTMVYQNTNIMKLYEILSLKMMQDTNIKEDIPSCVVPNAALSPSEVMRLYSRGDIKPLANTFTESQLVERPAHTDTLLALSQAQDFNNGLHQLALQPISPQITDSGLPPAQPPAEPPAE